MDPVLSDRLRLLTILLFCFCLRDDLIKRLRLEHPKLLEVRLCRGLLFLLVFNPTGP